MMRIAFFGGRQFVGNRPFDWDHVDDSPRGLTGSDNSFLGQVRAMRDRGHDVRLFVHGSPHRTWEGIPLAPSWDLGDQPGFDAVVGWNEADVFARVHPSAARASCNQLVNYDFACRDFEKSVDLFLAISQWQWNLLRERAHDRSLDSATYRILPNGCDLNAYPKVDKVKGLCAYTSSPDRALHVVSLAWPHILEHVPWARLRVYYHSYAHWLEVTENWSTHPEPAKRELARRAGIVKQALERHKDTIEFVGGVSRQRLAKELSEAEVLLYPADPTVPTETFGVAVIEGCASGALPVISSADCFGEVYGGSCPQVPAPAEQYLDAYVKLAVRAMTDQTWADAWRARARALAERHAWPVLAEKLEGYLLEAIEKKREAA